MMAPAATNSSEPSNESVKSCCSRYLPIRQSIGSQLPGTCGYWIHESGVASQRGSDSPGATRAQPKPPLTA